jgi:serine/threonine-protein kinase
MSRPLAVIVHRLLQKDPAARYSSAAELATALGALAEPTIASRVFTREPEPEPTPRRHAEPLEAWATVTPKRPRGYTMRALGVVAALLLIAFGGMAALRARTVPLTDVRHAPVARARAVLTTLGVTPSVVERADMTVPAGEVIAERPSPGAPVHHGDAVQLVVSSGPPIVTVPDVHGVSTANAEHALLAVHLHPNVASRADDAPPQTVIAQDPAAGTQVRGGTNVVIIVSTGPGEANPGNDSTPPDVPNAGSSAAPNPNITGPDNNASPPPGWLRRQWWHLFHHRRHDAPPPPPPPSP